MTQGPDQRAATRGLQQLGSRTEIPASPDEALIEVIAWSVKTPICVRLTCPEFTSLCPITGAPDFARIIIDYIPSVSLVESKSLKLYLHSFRNHGAFHEQVVDAIGSRLWVEVGPVWLRVAGLFFPRGGIPIDVFWSRGSVPEGTTVPGLVTSPYEGR